MYEKSRNDLNLRTLQKAPRFTLMYECIITSKNGPKKWENVPRWAKCIITWKKCLPKLYNIFKNTEKVHIKKKHEIY